MNQEIVYLNFPVFVKWYITSKCNIRCKHCYISNYNDTGNINKIIKIIDYLGKKGVQSISILGGEPLARLDLEQIISQIKINGINVKIATNVILATRERAMSLVRAGAMQFQISIESHLASVNDDIRGKGSFEKICNGIKNLINAGASVSLAITLTRRNCKHIDEFYCFAKDLAVSGIKFNAYIPTNKNIPDKDDPYSLDHEIVQNCIQEIEYLKHRHPSLKIDAGAFVNQKYIKFIKQNQPYTFGCGAGTSTLVINSNFTISACDLINEIDRTNIIIENPADIENIWKNNIIFEKSRGKNSAESEFQIEDFSSVHQNRCQVAFTAYKDNIFK